MMKFNILVLCLILLLCGCVKKDQTAETIKFATWGSASEMAILKPIITNFENNNPGVKVDLMHIPQNYFQKIHLLFASNLEPDVVFINNLNLPVYASRLTPVNIDKSKYYKQSIEALSYNGQIYAVPRDVSTLVIFYNKELFDKAGLAYPDKDWNIYDMVSVARKLTTDTQYGIGYEEDMYYALPYILTMGGNIYPPEKVSEQKGLIYYKKLANQYNYAPSKSEVGSKTLAQLFLEEKIAMHLSGRWLVPKYSETAKFRWGVVNFPGIVPCDASGWAVSKNSKHKETALKFVEYLSSKENINKMTQSGLIVPARLDVLFNDTPFINAVSKSTTIPITTSYNKIIDKLNDTVFLNNP